jgi:hypothetical protein
MTNDLRLLNNTQSILLNGELFKGHKRIVLGRRQVVRHRVLIPAFRGSSPLAPAIV